VFIRQCTLSDIAASFTNPASPFFGPQTFQQSASPLSKLWIRPCEVQDQLSNTMIFFNTSSYWQLTVHLNDCEKTALCPGASMGIFEFFRMLFGLNGAPMPHALPNQKALLINQPMAKTLFCLIKERTESTIFQQTFRSHR